LVFKKGSQRFYLFFGVFSLFASFYFFFGAIDDSTAEFLNFNSAKRTTMLRKVDDHWQLFADMVVPEAVK
jgi:hypothetical protein